MSLAARLHHRNHNYIPCERSPDGALIPIPEWRVKGMAAAPYGSMHAIVFEKVDEACDDIVWYHANAYKVKDRTHIMR